MNRKLFAVLLSIVVLPLWGCAQPSAEVAQKIQAVEAGLIPVGAVQGEAAPTMTLADRMARYKVPGLSVVVINHFEIEWARGYGVVEAGGDDPVTTETLFQAASISKPVAATAALRLVQEGRLSLDEDVNTWLESWQVPENALTRDEKVTLRRLLTHSAGLTVHGFRGYAQGEHVPATVHVLDGAPPANSAPIRADFVPGTQWRYSGGGYTVMQQLLEDVTGQPFPDILRTLVLDPLGMAHSTYEQPLPPERAASAATGHRSSGKPVEGHWHTYPEMAAAGLWTTPSDLARFAIELQHSNAGQSNKVLSAETTEEMLTAGIGNWGLGPGVQGSGDSLSFSHGGANEGFRCFLFAYAETGQGAVVMTNSDAGGRLGAEMIGSIARAYDWPNFQADEGPKPISAVLGEKIWAEGVEAAISLYHDLKRRDSDAYNFGESQLNTLGYQYLQGSEVETAIALFKLNVEAYPDAFNPYDSLGEAYMMHGDTTRAIANYKKSLELNPNNTGAVEMLARMGVVWDAQQDD